MFYVANATNNVDINMFWIDTYVGCVRRQAFILKITPIDLLLQNFKNNKKGIK